MNAKKEHRKNARPESPDAGGSVHVGDRYHLRDKSASLEIMRVTEWHVEWVVCAGGESWRAVETLETFRELERRSLEMGAVFEPAQNAR